MCSTSFVLNMDRREIVKERLQRKLALNAVMESLVDGSHQCGDARCTDNHSQQQQQTIPEEAVFDIIPSTLQDLDDAIKKCVIYNIALKPYSSLTFKHQKTSLTEIPGLINLFQDACLNHGLLGYLDWVHETKPSDHNTIVMNNIIIITCGTVVFNPETDIINPENDDAVSSETADIVHDIDPTKLAFLRKKSRAKFDAMIAPYI